MPKSPYEKYIRQIEIIALCSQMNISKKELAEIFSVSIDLISADISELKAEGIAISSTKHCVRVSNLERFRFDKIDFYLRLRRFDFINSKAITNLINVLEDKALFYLVAIFKEIEAKRSFSFEYEYKNKSIKIDSAKALCLHLEADDYRFIAEHESKVKQFAIKKLKNLDVSTNIRTMIDAGNHEGYYKIKEIEYDARVAEALKYSFGGWISDSRVEVKVELQNDFKNKTVFADQKEIEVNPNSKIVTGSVNSIDEFAKYIILNASQIKAISPEELIVKIKDYACKILKAYK